MFASGNFRNFPIDDDVSIGTASDLVRGSLSSISSSSDESSYSDLSLDSIQICAHAHSFEGLPEIPADQPIDVANVNNTRDLCDSMHVILSLPHLCDVTFLVGPALTPIYGLKAVMATRSRVLHTLFLAHSSLTHPAPTKQHKAPTGCFPKLFRSKRRTKNDNSPKPDMIISLPEHDPVCFRAFVTYLHTGSANVNVHNLPGLLYLTEMYAVPELHKACWDFVERCVTSQTAISLLTSAQKYAHSESAGRLIDLLLSYIDAHTDRLLPHLHTAPSSIATLILSRPQLRLSPTKRVAAILLWTKRQQRGTTKSSPLPPATVRLLDTIDFSQVSDNVRNDVIDLGFVPPMPVTDSSLSTTETDDVITALPTPRLRKQDHAKLTKTRLTARANSESGYSS